MRHVKRLVKRRERGAVPLRTLALACLCAVSPLSAARSFAQGPASTGPLVPGWNALLRPGAVNITYGGYFGLDPHDYDWTGLDVQEQVVYAPRFPGPQPTFDPVYMTFQNGFFATFGPPAVLSTAFSAVGKPSTYKWQWHPPIVPSTAYEDFIHFPAPPLYVLDRVDGYNYALAYGYGTSRVTGTLDVDGDGCDHVYSNRSYNVLGTPDGHIGLAQMLARRIVAADTDFTAQAQAQVKITPKLAGHGESFPDADGNPTGNGGFRVWVSSNGYPLSLSSIHPGNTAAFEPFSLPQLGDDNYSNKFIYNGDVPALLRVPLAIRAQGAAQDDMQWLVDNDKVGWKIDPAIDGWIPYTKLASNDEVIPVTNGENGVAIYQGLPDTDADFGLKTVILKVEGHESQQASIQTFFGATDRNHPHPEDGAYLDSGPGSITPPDPTELNTLHPGDGPASNPPAGPVLTPTPNWYYYYNKMYRAVPAVYQNVPKSHCDSGYIAFDGTMDAVDIWSFSYVKGIYIGNDAFGAWTFPVFVMDGPDMKYDGKLTVGGIHNYIYTVGHEIGHALDVTAGLVNRKYRNNSDGQVRRYDRDSDGVTNNAELANGLDPDAPDTTRAFPFDPEGDKEVLACIHGLADLLPQKEAWKRDWSSAGLQYAGLDDSRWGPHNPDFFYSSYWGPPVAAPYHPWNYETVDILFGVAFPTGNYFTNPNPNAVTVVNDPYSGPDGTVYP